MLIATGGAGALAGALALSNTKDPKNKEGYDPYEISPVQKPVITSFSDENLLSLNKNKTTGSIIVFNANEKAVEKFTIKPLSDIISIDENSSCSDIVPAYGFCEFKISYTGEGQNETSIPVLFEIGSNSLLSDFITINAIDMPLGNFFRPDKDTTEGQHNAKTVITSFASTDKNGVHLLYAGTLGDGVLKSTDEGNSWIQINSGITDKQINTLHSVNNILFAGTENEGVFKSTDDGASWISLRNGLADKKIMDIHSIDETLYVATYKGGVFRKSVNGADSWAYFSDGLPQTIRRGVTTADIRVTALHSIGSILYAGTYRNGVFKITEGTDRWEPANNTIENEKVSSITSIENSLYIGTPKNGVFISDDGGDIWIKSSGVPDEILTIYAFKGELYVGTKGHSIIKSSDKGKTWIEVNDGLMEGGPIIPAIYSLGDKIFAGTMNGVFRSPDGKNWKEANKAGLPGTPITSIQSIEEELYLATMVNGIFKSIDGGINWKPINEGLPSDSFGYPEIYSMQSIDNNLYLGTELGLFKSINRGESWDIIDNRIAGLSIQTLHVSGNTLYVGAENEIFRSDDGGVSWNDLTHNLPKAFIDSIHAFDGNLYVGARSC